MSRAAKNMLRRASLAFQPFACPVISGVYFAEGGGGTGGGGGAAGGAAGGDGGGAAGAAGGAGAGAGGTGDGNGAGDTKPDVVPASEARDAYAARDKAKKEYKAALTLLGFEPGEVRIVATADPENPFKLEGDRAEEFKAAIERAKGTPKPKAGKPDEVEAAYTARVAALTKKQQAEVGAYQSLLSKLAVSAPLQAACAAEGIIDADESGTYADVIKLLSDRIQTEFGVGEDGNAFAIVKPLNEDGTVMADAATGKVADLRTLVKKFAEKRPHMKRHNGTRGPGAGGYGGQPQASGRGQNGTPEAVAAAAAAGMFGRTIANT